MNEADTGVLENERVDGQAVMAHRPPTGHRPDHVGLFTFYFDDDRWVWSPEVERIHGYRQDTVAPGTALVLSHVHPDDCQHVAAALYEMRRSHAPFSSRHRIVDARFRVRDVVMVGWPFYDARGALLGMHGCYLDVTPTVRSGAPAWQEMYGRLAQRLRVTAANGLSEHQRRRVRAATRC
jgi:PAS domain-containing protein